MLRYQTLAGYKGHEWNTRTRMYRSKQRALQSIKKLVKFFGHATLLTYAREEQAYCLVETQDF